MAAGRPGGGGGGGGGSSSSSASGATRAPAAANGSQGRGNGAAAAGRNGAAAGRRGRPSDGSGAAAVAATEAAKASASEGNGSDRGGDRGGGEEEEAAGADEGAAPPAKLTPAEQAEKLKKLKEISQRLSQVMEDSKSSRRRSSMALALHVPYGPPVVMGDEFVMAPKGHGTSSAPVQQDLRWGCDPKLADKICNFNRHAAEEAGYFQSTSFLREEPPKGEEEVTFYDSNTGKALFHAPRNRSFEDFAAESKSHGWPSFRDAEVNWDLVRVLPNGETVSIHGTHLGHNLPDSKGNRYCINLVSVAGRPQRGGLHLPA